MAHTHYQLTTSSAVSELLLCLLCSLALWVAAQQWATAAQPSCYWRVPGKFWQCRVPLQLGPNKTTLCMFTKQWPSLTGFPEACYQESIYNIATQIATDPYDSSSHGQFPHSFRHGKTEWLSLHCRCSAYGEAVVQLLHDDVATLQFKAHAFSRCHSQPTVRNGTMIYKQVWWAKTWRCCKGVIWPFCSKFNHTADESSIAAACP